MLSGLGRIVSSKAPEFPKDFNWINTTEPLSLLGLRGHIVILDFWTYGCINCIHMVPILEKLQEAFKDQPVIVIGVHSAKFANEQKAENIAEAVKRYEITHPVVVDEKMQIWKSYGINAWPTLVIIGPKGNIVRKRSGETGFAELDGIVQMLLDDHRDDGTLAKKRIEIKMPAVKDRRVLSYPQKIAFSPDGSALALSDTNHNRILIVNPQTGKISTVIGSGERGFKDGSFASAQFLEPRGILWVGNVLYIADTGNHAIRAADLTKKTASTVAGTGTQGGYYPLEFSGNALSTDLSSPWDIALYNGRLIIAMAGLHQLWSYEPKSGLVFPFAGNGGEGIVDGDYRNSEFAQPSGLFVEGDFLYVADPESSGIRSIDLKKRFVGTISGHGLFVFGHKDGKLNQALMQHPYGLCANDGMVYVADTYNSAIRMIDLKKETVVTLVGTPNEKSFCKYGDPDCDTVGLYEPSDVKLMGNRLFIADTNNHLIRVFDLKSMLLSTLEIKQ
ncbi:MAG: redoxin domain-containing protein [Candidatus Micrarchaeales archaeon]|nr:redoxin domain-containing protein [Candidatus Micrarchaeales archaeon]